MKNRISPLKVVSKYLTQPLRMRRDYGEVKSQIDDYPQQPFSSMPCPECGHENRFKTSEQQDIKCSACSSMFRPGKSRSAVTVGDKPYSHEELLKDMEKAVNRGEIKVHPSDLKSPGKGPIKSGQGLFETLSDIQERVVPQIEKYIDIYSGDTRPEPGKAPPKDEPLSTDFRKQVGIAAKAYSEFFSRLGEINDLLHRNVKLAQDFHGSKDNSIISTLEEIADTGAKQGFKKLKSLGFSQWTKNFLNRVKHIQSAVEGLAFK
jgi:ribosomal protein S27E